MYSALVFKTGEHAVAAYIYRPFFKSAQLGGVYVDVFDAPAVLFGVHFVHTHDFHGKQCRLFSACAAANFYYDVFVVVGIFRKQQNFQLAFGFLHPAAVFFHFRTSQLGQFRVIGI